MQVGTRWKLFLSREMVTLVYDQGDVRNYSNERLEYLKKTLEAENSPKKKDKKDQSEKNEEKVQRRRKKDEKSLDEQRKKTKNKAKKLKKNLVDIKSGLFYKHLRKRVKSFEKALMHSNIKLILGTIAGDTSHLLEWENILTQRDSEKTSAKTFMAIIGLQSYKRLKQKDQAIFRSYLSVLSSNIESDVRNLEELLTLLLTRKANVRRVTQMLDIEDPVKDVLMINLLDGSEEGEEGSDKNDLIESVLKKIFEPEIDIDVCLMIRDLYLLKDRAWKKLAGGLIIGRKGRPSDLIQSLINKIDFKKLREQVDNGENKKLIDSLKVPKEFKNNNEQDEYDYILKLIMESDLFKASTYHGDEYNLHMQYRMLNLIIKQDFSAIFKIAIGSDEEMIHSVADVFKFKNAESFKLLKLFLKLANIDLYSQKKDKKYPDIVNKIINDMEEAKILEPFTGSPTRQNLHKLLLGIIGGDLELCIHSLIEANAMEEANLLYNLYGSITLNELLTMSDKFQRSGKLDQSQQLNKQVKSHLLSILPYTSFYHSINDEKNKIPKEMERDDKDLKKKTQKLFSTILKRRNQKASTHMPHDRSNYTKSLRQHIMQSFKDDKGKHLHKKDLNYELSKVLWSTCNGSLLIKLIDTYVKHKEINKLLKSLFQLIILLQRFYTKGEGQTEVENTFQQLIEDIQKVNHNEALNKILTLAPDLMRLSFSFEMVGSERAIDMPKIKLEAFSILSKIVSVTTSEEQQKIIFDFMSVILGINIKKFIAGEKKDEVLKKYDLKLEKRLEIFFCRICDIFFPNIMEKDSFDDAFKQIYSLFTRLRTDFTQGFKDPQKLRLIAKDMLEILEDFKLVDQPIMEALIGLLDGDLEGCEDLIEVYDPNISRPVITTMLNYLSQALELIGFNFFSKAKSLPSTQPGSLNNINSKEWTDMLKKIEEGKATTNDLFKMVDAEGDRSGTISKEEFQTLTIRLGLKLSPHRITEIFAKVKGKQAQTGNKELNEQEFAKAVVYLQEKNVTQALQLLGITPEMLTAILIRLVILLILIFIFIFLGIKAFAVGGTFGSIVSSVFPAAGGLALGKEKDSDKDKLDQENVKDAADKGFQITASEEL